VSTGTLTQEDPIGLAGGLNLYGFAGGDPINFSDPYGLCPELPELCGIIGANAGQSASEYWAQISVATSGWRAAGADALGTLASLWTPETWKGTAATLASGLAVNSANKRLGPGAAAQLLFELLTGEFEWRRDKDAIDNALQEQLEDQREQDKISGSCSDGDDSCSDTSGEGNTT